MLPIKINRTLLILAITGIFLYFSAIVWEGSTGGGSIEDELKPPKISKQLALATAEDFIQKQFSTTSQLHAEIYYESNQTLSGYLQKSNRYQAYRAQYGQKYPLDYWQIEAQDLNSQQRYIVQIGLDTPTVTSWKSLDVHEAVSERASQQIAENFLKTAGYALNDFTLLKQEANTKNHYVFESSTIQLGEAKLQLNMEVSGNQLTALEPNFTVPKEYKDWLNKQESSAQLMSWASLLVTFIMGIAALIYVIRYRKNISFSRGLLFTLLFAAIYTLNTFNTIPSIKTPGKALSSDPTPIIIFSLIVIAILAVSLYLSVLAGDQLWKQKGWNAWPRFREAQFGMQVWYAMGRGYLLCLFILGIQQVLFLFAGQIFASFGVNDPSQSVYNMLWPGLFPTMAWMAGISEEITFRLFGIVFFKKLLRINFLAVLLPSIIWALAHAQYSIYPSYTRLFEVTVLGLIFGYAFLKYGLITAIFAHVTMDSILMGLSLMFNIGNGNYIGIGLLYLILPALVALIILLLHRQLYKTETIASY